MSNVTELLLYLNTYLSHDFLRHTEEIPSDILYVLQHSFHSVKSQKRDPTILDSIQSALDIIWENLNTGHWSNVPEIHRKLYSLFSFLKVLALLKEDSDNKNEFSSVLKAAIKAADLGLLLGNSCRKELSHAATLLNRVIHGDCISHWPALSKWQDLKYIKSVAGCRTVPIELGSSYTHEDWGMKLLTIEEFIQNHICSSGDKVGYLAQHQLFDQIPELKNDICIPEYCCLTKSEDLDSEPDINAWFGPRGTVTPLHYDPKHNLLCQVVGRKKLLLYSPEDSDFLYPHETKMLHNTAQVDPQKPDYKSFPRYKLAKGFECVLNPGEMLYIPPKWWHYVKSMDVSFSVSFWWT
ncbi:bifunctional peptidase and arginyl-hydroxylase JMJD5-like isoform X2 [Rhodnius prolixus]|uniref:bifunctional peptidase and arginyl-hydroxylase JMJD5-like isoform X2 n=1 Tax=Rhodnius prolixus TaxID=13249 RepID=UPI003D1896B0